MNEGSTHYTDVKYLVTAGPRVELAGEETLGKPRNVKHSTEGVHPAHYEEPRNCIHNVLILEPLSENHVDTWDKPVETKQKEGCKAKRTVFVRSKFSPEGDDDAPCKQDDEDCYVDTLCQSVAVETVVVGRDTGSCDEDGNARVVESTEDTIYAVRVVAKEVEESGAGETDHGREEETEQHCLLGGREFVDFDIFKQERDVVAVHIDPQTEGNKEGKPQKVGPNVPCLCVHAKHALEAAEKGIHLRSVLGRQVLIVLHPAWELGELLRSPVVRRGASKRRRKTTVVVRHSGFCSSSVHTRRVKITPLHFWHLISGRE